MRNFKKLKIWQKGFEIAVKPITLTATFPKEEKYGICTQVTKAAVSVPSNIAEGSSRSSEKYQKRFLEIASGSTFELETQLLISKAVNFGDENIIKDILNDVDQEQKMLMSFFNKIKS